MEVVQERDQVYFKVCFVFSLIINALDMYSLHQTSLQLHHDLNNTEKSFAHLHARFEKLKTAVEVYKKVYGKICHIF